MKGFATLVGSLPYSLYTYTRSIRYYCVCIYSLGYNIVSYYGLVTGALFFRVLYLYTESIQNYSVYRHITFTVYIRRVRWVGGWKEKISTPVLCVMGGR